jgi:hypothetical protein
MAARRAIIQFDGRFRRSFDRIARRANWRLLDVHAVRATDAPSNSARFYDRVVGHGIA